jgi:HK97 gp10 family phage protein
MSRVDGVQELLYNLGILSAETERQAKQIIESTAIAIQADSVQAIEQGHKSGRVYLKTKAKIKHVSSAPGEAPATDTGTLVKSIRYKNEPDGVAYVYTNLKYAPWLELGTRIMEPRPFLMPALEGNRKKFNDSFDALVKNAQGKFIKG